MKVKGLRWWVLSLILIITIINYLDRGTLNYMWYTKKAVQFSVVEHAEAGKNCAVYDAGKELYVLTTETGKKLEYGKDKVAVSGSALEAKIPTGIALDLGLVDASLSEKAAEEQQKSIYMIINIIFMCCYGISQLFSGKIYDKIGTRRGFVMSAIIWGVADVLASLSRGFKSLSFFRGMLGLGEAGPWPGTTKSNAEWFPQKERALAQGMFGAAASVGSVLAPIVISMLFLSLGWQATFVTVGCLGLLWLAPWLIVNKKGPKEHAWITDSEREYILSGQPEAKLTVDKGLSWRELLSQKKSYSVILGRIFLDPIWWMFVAWLPIYLMQVHNLDIKQVAATAWVPYFGAAIGSVAGGWMSGRLIKAGRSVNFSRKAAILTGAGVTLSSVMAIIFATNITLIVTLMAFVLGGYQFAMTNIQTLPSDFHSGKSVGSLAGLGGLAAVVGTISCMFLVPLITEGQSWTLFFVMLASLVPVSVCSIFITAGKIESVKK
ncbi:MAG: MFS transporter [Prevotellaceae bacterium]|jgi:ACS family hexuronate transporter-like MFS transporter|nr:MFS transporter [Prevotellaceae bacterium]